MYLNYYTTPRHQPPLRIQLLP